MGKLSARKRRQKNFTVQKRKIAMKQKVVKNLSKPRTEAAKEAVRLGIKDRMTGPVGALPRFLQRNLTGRSIDLSPAALKGRTHKGVSSGGITRAVRPKVKRYKRWQDGRRTHLLEETNALTGDKLRSPYHDEGLPDKREFWIIKPNTPMGDKMGLKPTDKPLYIPKGGPSSDTFQVTQGGKVIIKGKLK